MATNVWAYMAGVVDGNPEGALMRPPPFFAGARIAEVVRRQFPKNTSESGRIWGNRRRWPTDFRGRYLRSAI